LHLASPRRAWVRRASSQYAGLSILLRNGIGDTIRVSLTPRPGGDRTRKCWWRKQVLQSLGISQLHPTGHRMSRVWSHTSTFFQEMAEQIQTLSAPIRRPAWQARYPGSEELRVAVMGAW